MPTYLFTQISISYNFIPRMLASLQSLHPQEEEKGEGDLL